MAVYEYRCGKCGAEFELRRPMSEAEAPAMCPGCGGQGRKLPSVFGSKEGYKLRIPAKEPFRGTPSAGIQAS